jgi:hypothetical protein
MIDPTTLDTTPRGLAQQTLDHDREVSAVLATASGSLQAIAWNRYARMTSRRSAARSLRRRHQERRARRRWTASAD